MFEVFNNIIENYLKYGKVKIGSKVYNFINI